jgi:TRAP-type uncharacterized transport system substrate-binding protein
MSRAYLCVPLAAILAFLAGCNSASSSTQNLKTTITTGPEQGYYQKVCRAIQPIAKRRGMDVQCLPCSNGSLENVYKLEQGRAEFALVQSDVAHRAWKGEYPFEEPHPQIQLVSPLFTEKVHILVGPHQYLSSVAQLKGKRVWLGAKDSGSRSSAFAVLRAAGLEFEDVRKMAATSMDSRKAFALLRADKPPLDAVIDTDMPDQRILVAMLASSGIKMAQFPLGKKGQFWVLQRPELSISAAADLKGAKIGLGPGWSGRELSQLAKVGITGTSNSVDVQKALEQLQSHQLDALLEPEQLSPELSQAILATHNYRVLPLGADPRTNGKKGLLAFLPPGSTISSAAELTDKKLWWAPGDKALDEAIYTAICGGQCRKSLNVLREINTEAALDLLRLGELDAVLQTTVAPNAAIAGVVNKDTEISLLGLDLPLLEKLVNDGSYVETSLQSSAYPGLTKGVYAVGVQTFLLTALSKKAEGGQKVELMARILREEQPAIEQNLREEVLQEKSSPAEPFALTLLGSPISSQVVEFVHSSAGSFLVKPGYPRRGEVLHMCEVLAAILTLGAVVLVMERRRRLAPRTTSCILFSLACMLVWAVGALWLQSVEGDITQDFVDLTSAGASLGRTVLLHFGLPLKPAVPTTRNGQLIMDIFSWLGTLLLGGHFLPSFKWLWHKRFASPLEELEGEILHRPAHAATDSSSQVFTRRKHAGNLALAGGLKMERTAD